MKNIDTEIDTDFVQLYEMVFCSFKVQASKIIQHSRKTILEETRNEIYFGIVIENCISNQSNI